MTSSKTESSLLYCQKMQHLHLQISTNCNHNTYFKFCAVLCQPFTNSHLNSLKRQHTAFGECWKHILRQGSLLQVPLSTQLKLSTGTNLNFRMQSWLRCKEAWFQSFTRCSGTFRFPTYLCRPLITKKKSNDLTKSCRVSKLKTPKTKRILTDWLNWPKPCKTSWSTRRKSKTKHWST